MAVDTKPDLAADFGPDDGRARGPAGTNAVAIASLIFGIVGFVSIGLGSIIALVLGYRARRQIRAARGSQSGAGLALAGIILGWVVAGLNIAVLLLLIALANPVLGAMAAAVTATLVLACIFGDPRMVTRYTFLTVLAFIVLFPILITLVNSVLRPTEIASRPPDFWPNDPQWHTYGDAWDSGHMSTYLRNSFIVTVIIVTGQLVTSILAAYAFAFLEFPFKRTLFVLFLTTLMIPFEVTIVTNLSTINNFGWFDTYQGLAVPFLATGFGAFLLRQSFLQVPRDLQDAAALDGYGHWRFMARVAVPLSRPAVAALAVFAFLTAWNQYLWPLLVTEDDDLRTVQIGLKQLRGTQLDQINVTFAGVIIAAAPLVVLLIIFQKQLVRGLTAGAVKG